MPVPRTEQSHQHILRSTKRSSPHTLQQRPTPPASQVPSLSTRRHHKRPSQLRRQCGYCGTHSTPMWRHGPPEADPLCNSCGVKWKRGRILEGYCPPRTHASAVRSGSTSMSMSSSTSSGLSPDSVSSVSNMSSSASTVMDGSDQPCAKPPEPNLVLAPTTHTTPVIDPTPTKHTRQTQEPPSHPIPKRIRKSINNCMDSISTSNPSTTSQNTTFHTKKTKIQHKSGIPKQGIRSNVSESMMNMSSSVSSLSSSSIHVPSSVSSGMDRMIRSRSMPVSSVRQSGPPSTDRVLRSRTSITRPSTPPITTTSTILTNLPSTTSTIPISMNELIPISGLIHKLNTSPILSNVPDLIVPTYTTQPVSIPISVSPPHIESKNTNLCMMNSSVYTKHDDDGMGIHECIHNPYEIQSPLLRTRYLATRLSMIPVSRLVEVLCVLDPIVGHDVRCALNKDHLGNEEEQDDQWNGDVEVDMKDVDDGMWRELCCVLGTGQCMCEYLDTDHEIDGDTDESDMDTYINIDDDDDDDVILDRNVSTYSGISRSILNTHLRGIAH